MILEQAIEAVGGAQADTEVNVLYMYLLDACEKVFDNELDQATFEEHMRWFFGTKASPLNFFFALVTGLQYFISLLPQAYQIFTLDRVITAIIKQVSQICDRLGGSHETSADIPCFDFVVFIGADHLGRLQRTGAMVAATKITEPRARGDLRYYPVQTRRRAQHGVRRSSVSC